MKNLFITVMVMFALTGCSSIDSFKQSGWVPSFWDDNQSLIIVDAQLAVNQFDCAGDQLAQITRIETELARFELYSVAKGWQQTDVLQLIKPMQDTVAAFRTRVEQKGNTSSAFCKIKMDVIQLQAERASQAVLGRF